MSRSKPVMDNEPVFGDGELAVAACNDELEGRVEANILVIDDEENIRFTFKNFLSSAGHKVATATNCREARQTIDAGGIDLVFADFILPDGNGLDLLQEIRLKMPACQVVLITAYPCFKTARDAFKLGAFDYIEKPVRQQMVLETVSAALQEQADGAQAENDRQQS